jgi:SPP1 gp7 family putative phage head morphogenesis protein
MTTTRGASFLRQLTARRGSAVALERARGGSARSRRLRRKKIRLQRQPDAIRRTYYEAIAALTAQAREAVRRVLYPLGPSLVEETTRARGDASSWVNAPTPEYITAHEATHAVHVADRPATLRLDSPASAQRIFRDLARDFFAEFSNEKVAATVRRFGVELSDYQRREVARQFEQAIGFDPFRMGEAWLPARIEGFTAENVALIRTVPERYFADIETNLIRSLRGGMRWEEIAPMLEERFGVAESNAERIARDQVGKFYAELNQARQRDVGVDSYVWRTARDNRVRDSHYDLEGTSFTWESGGDAIEGNPGEPINCRCQAEPDLTPLLDALDAT